MFVIYFVLISKTINCLFVELGEYPKHLKYDINLPDCGLRSALKVIFPTKCFANTFENKSFVNESPPSHVSGRIWHGRDTVPGEAPWNVRLEIFRASRRRPGICTGFLVTWSWVITAAHCVWQTNNNQITRIHATAGSPTWMIPADMKMIIIHPAFVYNVTQTVPYDLAMIKLERKFAYTLLDNQTVSINTICLPKEGELNQNYENATFVGWGVMDVNNTLAQILQIESVVLKPTEECTHQQILCADHKSTDPRTCGGDSGGPLFQITDSGIAIIVGHTQGKAEENSKCEGKPVEGQWVSFQKHLNYILYNIEVNE